MLTRISLFKPYMMHNQSIFFFLREMHKASIDLKEKIDKQESWDLVKMYFALYDQKWKQFVKICPKEIIERSELNRHSHFLGYYVNREDLNACYSDLQKICSEDIYNISDACEKYFSENPELEINNTNWSWIHRDIRKTSQKKFEDSHFADAVESAFKGINKRVKLLYKSKTGDELDGDGLMKQAFASNNANSYTPHIYLANNNDVLGRNIQQGYMEIFAGCMKGIRNPKAHDNLIVNLDEAWEMIVMASHLMRMLDKFNK